MEDIMKEKNLRKTDGLPFYLGVASGILFLINTIISINVKPLIKSALYKSQNLNMTVNPVTNLVESIIGYIIFPGIFLILLFIGKNSPKRGKAFGVVWIVLSGLSIISSVFSKLMGSSELIKKTTEITANIVNAIIPGGMALYTAVSMLGTVCMLASCIVFLTRFKMPEKLTDEVSN